MSRKRTLTMRLTNGMFSVEHMIEFSSSEQSIVMASVEDAIDELNHKLSVCEQALEPRGTFKEIPDPNPGKPDNVLHHFEKWKGPRR